MVINTDLANTREGLEAGSSAILNREEEDRRNGKRNRGDGKRGERSGKRKRKNGSMVVEEA